MAVSVDLDKEKKHIAIYAEWRFKELCKSLPGASWSAEEQIWRVPLSWTSCLALRSTFKDNLIIKDDLLAWANEEMVSRIKPSLDLRELESADGDEALFPHQRAGVKFLATARRALLAIVAGVCRCPFCR